MLWAFSPPHRFKQTNSVFKRNFTGVFNQSGGAQTNKCKESKPICSLSSQYCCGSRVCVPALSCSVILFQARKDVMFVGDHSGHLVMQSSDVQMQSIASNRRRTKLWSVVVRSWLIGMWSIIMGRFGFTCFLFTVIVDLHKMTLLISIYLIGLL